MRIDSLCATAAAHADTARPRRLRYAVPSVGTVPVGVAAGRRRCLDASRTSPNSRCGVRDAFGLTA